VDEHHEQPNLRSEKYGAVQGRHKGVLVPADALSQQDREPPAEFCASTVVTDEA
jgi:hypothetical protein